MGGKLDAWRRAAGLTRGSVQSLVAFLAQGSASGNGRERGRFFGLCFNRFWNRLNSALAYTRRSNSKTHGFHFGLFHCWVHFGLGRWECMQNPKMLPEIKQKLRPVSH